MKIEKKDNLYRVESSQGGKFYIVDTKKPYCECPAFKFRHMRSKTDCKHIKAVKEWIEENEGSETKVTMEVVAKFLEDKGEADSVKMIELFGEEIIDELISKGELIESKGKIRLV